MENAKILAFSCTIGVNAGYGHGNEENQTAATVVAAVWQKNAKKIMDDGGEYITAVVKNSLTVYNTEWGCPEGGEVTATCSGSANPEFVQDLEAWKQAVLVQVEAVKAELEQATVVVEFSELDSHVYLKG